MALIELRELTKYYQMGDTLVHALDGVSLDIEKGEFVAITGASGSGKSTMMHLLGCLDRPTGGTYTLEGKNVSRLNDTQLANIRNEYIGFVFQTFNLINRTSAVENVSIPLFYAREDNTQAPARKALERVGLGKRWRHNPNELSGGERQRVAIARAIVNEPVLLLADEPTGNLDSKTGTQIMEIFHELSEQGVTIVLVTHEPDVAQQARRIIQMRDGKVISDRKTESRRPPAPEEPPSGGGEQVSAPDVSAPVTPVAAGSIAPGANATLIWGILAGVCLGTAALCSWYLNARAAAMKEAGLAPTGPQDTPQDLIVAGLVGVGGVLIGLITGGLAAFFGWRARKQIAMSASNWRGGRRIAIGSLFGWAAILVPAGVLGFSLVRRLV